MKRRKVSKKHMKDPSLKNPLSIKLYIHISRNRHRYGWASTPGGAGLGWASPQHSFDLVPSPPSSPLRMFFGGGWEAPRTKDPCRRTCIQAFLKWGATSCFVPLSFAVVEPNELVG